MKKCKIKEELNQFEFLTGKEALDLIKQGKAPEWLKIGTFQEPNEDGIFYIDVDFIGYSDQIEVFPDNIIIHGVSTNSLFGEEAYGFQVFTKEMYTRLFNEVTEDDVKYTEIQLIQINCEHDFISAITRDNKKSRHCVKCGTIIHLPD